MLLAVVMMLTVAPANLLASAAIDGIVYQEPTFSGGGSTFTVDTSATTEVVRVAYGAGMFTLGNSIVAATKSGIPKTSGSYANVAYAGETPETPKLVFTINGVQPDETPTKSCNVSSVQYGECKTTQSGSSYTYTWDLAGNAPAHSDLVFTITYKVAGSEYTAYAFSHVENILVMNGVVSYRFNDNGSNGKGRDSSIVQVQSHNMYASMCQDSVVSNRKVGFINYGTAQALSGNALLGCGSEEDLDGTINAYGASTGVAIDGTKVGSLIKVVKETTGTQRNCIYNNDTNRGESQVYLDKRTDTSLEAINLRVTLQNAEAADFGSSKFETFGIYHGHKTYGDEDGNSSLTGDATSSVIAVKSHSATGSDTITSSNAYGHVMTTLTGTGPSSSTTATFNSTKGEYEYSFVFGIWSEANGRTNRTAVGYNLDFVLYDTTDLYGVYSGIFNGTGSYTIKNVNYGGVSYAGYVCNFDRGVNPQAVMYSSNPTAWENFLAAYQRAGSLLREPDIGANWSFTNNAYVDSTSNKSATAQAEIDAAVYDLVIAYAALPDYHYQVDGIVNHVAIEADGTETLIGQQVYADLAAGTTMLAKPASKTPGYEVRDASPQLKLLSGGNESETVTFYYQPVKKQIVLITNNDNADVTTVADIPAGSIVSAASLPYGTKANFDFVQWVDQSGNVYSGDFKMPAENLTLTAQWTPSAINISAIPVIDGVERTDLAVTYPSVKPNADGVTAVEMQKPANLDIDGYIFVEFYEDKDLTTLMTWPKEFYLNDTLNFVFYARMVDVYGKIIYETNGGTAVADSTFAPGETVVPPETTKTGYTFAGWYKDKELTVPVENADWTLSDNTGFIAYAKWTANDYTITFDVGKTSTKYDTKTVRPITGAADTVIPADQYPEVPLKFGYIFDGWSYQGKRYDFTEGKTMYPTQNIVLEAIWRSTEYSAFADVTAYEKLSGEYTETDSAFAGDVVTFRMATKTNFFSGSSVFVFMYDANFFELVEEGTAAFAVNENSGYISGIDAKIQGVTNDAALPWPANLERTEVKADGTSAYYKAMMIAIDPTISAGNYNCEPMSDGEWIVEFKLRVKEDATGSGKVFMDNAWTRSQENIMGTMFYSWAESKTTSVADTQNNLVTPILEDAVAIINIETEAPANVKITVDPNGGIWADGTTAAKEYEGRTETEIIGYVAPTKEGYSLKVGANGKTVWANTADATDTWAEGYYGKEAQNGLTYAAQWTPNPYDINFYVEGELKKVVTVGYEESLAGVAYTPAAKQGYTFAYWADAEGNAVDFATMTCPIGGMDVNAVYTPATDTPFKVVAHYTTNASTGAQGSATANFTGTTGYEVQIVEAIPDPAAANTIYITLDMLPKAGNGNYIYDPANNTLPIKGTIAGDGSLVLDVNYIGKQMTYTFSANKGAWADGSTEYKEVGPFQSISQGPATEPVREGYNFLGWARTATATKPAGYTAGTTTLTADITFYAVWEVKKYPVNFNANGGTFADGTDVVTNDFQFDANITAPAAPSLAGYNFLGWALEADATEALTTLGKMDVANENGKTFYAVYAPISYTVTYTITCGGNTDTVSDGPFYNGDVVTLRTPEEIEGYTFDGWMIYGVPVEGNTITIDAADVEITGNYSAVSVPVYFNANGGFFDGDEAITEKTVEVEYTAVISKPSFTPARAGYEFLGWAATADAESTLTSLGSVTSVTEEYRFYAVWKATYASYTINVYMQDVNGAYPETADEVIDTNTGLVGEDVTYIPEAIDGFTVDADSVLTGTVVGDGSLELTVKYIRNKYEVKWLNFDGSEIRIDNVYYGAALNAPEATREGWTFADWTPSVAATMPANELEYTATFTVNYYNATLNANGGKFSDGNATKVVSTAYGEGVNPQEIPTMTGYTLEGWAYEGTTDVVISPDGTTTVDMVVGGLNFDAVWKVQKYSLSYRNYNNTEFQTFEVEYGTPAADMPVPATNPVRTGYYFNGWVGIPATMPAAQVRITPDFQLESYTLVFNTNGGSAIDDATVKFGDDFEAPADPTKVGYTFAGWDATIPSKIEDLGENGAVVTFNANWTINQYTITFANTGDTTIGAITQDYATAVTAPEAPTKVGYTFAGWDKEIPATMPAEDVTITANWTINQYTITFDTVGGTEIAAITQDYATTVAAPAAPTKEGYTFAGWDKEIPATMPAEDVTITANWTINQYTITFDTVGGTEIAAITQDYATDVAAPAAPTKEGYTFAGWDKEIPATMPAENVTITAQWTINQYTITFDTVGGSDIEAITQAYNTAVVAPAAPTKEGYTFAGWDKEIPATMPAEDVTITAIWTINQYTITFANTGDVTINPIAQDYGTTVTAPADPTKVGYTFAGWDKEIPATMPAENVTITAIWTINKYTITFDTVGGTEIAAIEQEYNTAVVAPAAPTKDGYTFAGWDKEIPATMPAEDVTITASWTINKYTVKFLDAADGVLESTELDYNAVIAAPASEPTKVHYTFAGWSLTKITEILNPEDIADVALIDFENAAPTVPVDGLTIYPVFVRVPVALATLSTAKVIETEDDGDVVVGYIAGLDTRLLEEDLVNNYITVEGDGRIEVELTKFGVCGTGTEVRIIDNVTDETVGIYYLVIYGDVNGDAEIDASDVSMIKSETLGVTSWSINPDALADGNETYDYSKVLAADMNGDGKVKSLDASLLTDVTLFLAEIDQQTGEIISY